MIENMIGKLKVGKATGPDGIPARVIKETTEQRKRLTIVMESCVEVRKRIQV
jgi:hypothetical protein